MGFFAQVTGCIEIDPARFGNQTSQDFRIGLAKIKLYPTNGEMQTAVLAAPDLRKEIADHVPRGTHVSSVAPGPRFSPGRLPLHAHADRSVDAAPDPGVAAR